MYRTFDNFLARDSWHTRHPRDETQFFVALDSVVKESQFNPDKMGLYMRQKTHPPVNTKDHSFDIAIEHYVAAAWAVKRYLAAAGGDQRGRQSPRCSRQLP